MVPLAYPSPGHADVDEPAVPVPDFYTPAKIGKRTGVGLNNLSFLRGRLVTSAEYVTVFFVFQLSDAARRESIGKFYR
jgi:hypothetical protein